MSCSLQTHRHEASLFALVQDVPSLNEPCLLVLCSYFLGVEHSCFILVSESLLFWSVGPRPLEKLPRCGQRKWLSCTLHWHPSTLYTGQALTNTCSNAVPRPPGVYAIVEMASGLADCDSQLAAKLTFVCHNKDDHTLCHVSELYTDCRSVACQATATRTDCLLTASMR